ncbi:hypothetical protein GCM10009555_076330 [Acrocarpospora macrocephala]|uniref:NADPH-dependent reductive aminase-like C-terminal domain-containing protein n=1 Tax=Acrocarpospora macrocephala TaxID=150177 RepID=A0A5M3WX44_9ACTN|nr:hypothetical protein Amac_063990 [Acrocarpospora macrocephala]
MAEWLPGYAEQIDGGSFEAGVSALETDARAMAHLIEESEAVGVNAELPKLIRAMADRSIAAGHGGEQYPVLIKEFSKPRNACPYLRSMFRRCGGSGGVESGVGRWPRPCRRR